MGRDNGALRRLLGFPRLGFETDPSWSYPSQFQDGWVWYQTGLGAEIPPGFSASTLLWLLTFDS